MSDLSLELITCKTIQKKRMVFIIGLVEEFSLRCYTTNKGYFVFQVLCLSLTEVLFHFDKIVKKVTNMSGLNEQGDNLVKVNNYHKPLFCYLTYF